MKKLFILFIAVVGFGVSGYAQTTSSAVSTTATIITPLTFTSTTPLAFGVISPDQAAPSTISINPVTNARTVLTGASKLFGLLASASTFVVNGQASTQISITLPQATVSLTGAGDPMTIASDTWVCKVAGVTTTTPTLDGSGNVTFKLGATLAVGQAQATGDYSSTYTVTVNYN